MQTATTAVQVTDMNQSIATTELYTEQVEGNADSVQEDAALRAVALQSEEVAREVPAPGGRVCSDSTL